MRTEAFKPRFGLYIPAALEPGVLYVSMDYATAAHLCPCGCEHKVVTPFGPTDWQLLFDGTVTLRPSIGNGQIPCRSHYFIRASRVVWAAPMTIERTRRAQGRDHAAILAQHAAQSMAQHAAETPRRSVWARLTSWIG